MRRDSDLDEPPVTEEDSDPFFGEAAEEDEEPGIGSVDTLEASPEDVVDQHTPAYPADPVPPDEERD